MIASIPGFVIFVNLLGTLFCPRPALADNILKSSTKNFQYSLSCTDTEGCEKIRLESLTAIESPNNTQQIKITGKWNNDDAMILTETESFNITPDQPFQIELSKPNNESEVSFYVVEKEGNVYRYSVTVNPQPGYLPPTLKNKTPSFAKLPVRTSPLPKRPSQTDKELYPAPSGSPITSPTPIATSVTTPVPTAQKSVPVTLPEAKSPEKIKPGALKSPDDFDAGFAEVKLPPLTKGTKGHIVRNFPNEALFRLSGEVNPGGLVAIAGVSIASWFTSRTNFMLKNPKFGIDLDYDHNVTTIKDQNGNPSNLSIFLADLKYNLETRSTNRNDLFGPVIGFEIPGLNASSVNLLGAGMFWSHPIYSSSDNALNKFKWLRHPKWFDLKAQYFFMTLSGANSLLQPNADFSARLKVYFLPHAFYSFGVNFYRFDYLMPNSTEGAATILTGSIELGLNF